MRNVMDLIEGDKGLRDRQGLDASMYVMGYIFKRQKKNGLAMREPGQEDGSQSRNATGAGEQLSSGNNPAGGVKTSRGGTRRAKNRILR